MKFFRLGSILVFAVLVIVCFVKLRAYQAGPAADEAAASESAWPDDIVDENLDMARKGSQGFTLFILFLVTAIIGGLLFVPKILSYFGEAVSEAVLASGEEAEADPYAEARSLVANGDYQDAVTAFRAIAKEHPEDRLPVLEMVKLFQDKLEQPQNAILTLETALRQDDHWDDDDKAFFMFKIVDLYHDHTDNKEGAVKMLKEVVKSFPKTRHASNAAHRLREIDPSQVTSTPSSPDNKPDPPKPSS